MHHNQIQLDQKLLNTNVYWNSSIFFSNFGSTFGLVWFVHHILNWPFWIKKISFHIPIQLSIQIFIEIQVFFKFCTAKWHYKIKKIYIRSAILDSENLISYSDSATWKTLEYQFLLKFKYFSNFVPQY